MIKKLKKHRKSIRMQNYRRQAKQLMRLWSKDQSKKKREQLKEQLLMLRELENKNNLLMIGQLKKLSRLNWLLKKSMKKLI